MNSRIVVTVGVVIAGAGPVDESLFGVVCITDVVADELLPRSNKPGEAEIAAAIAGGSIRIVEDVWMEPAFPMLDEGEASTLRAAVNQKRPCLVIIDETAGRTGTRTHGHWRRRCHLGGASIRIGSLGKPILSMINH
jgi:hypothetical protein